MRDFVTDWLGSSLRALVDGFTHLNATTVSLIIDVNEVFKV